MNYIINIETLTPLHIGSGNDIQRNFEFVYFSAERQVALLDDRKILGLIGTENLHNWVSALDKGEDLKAFVHKYSGQDITAPVIAKKIIPFEGALNNPFNQFREQVRSGNGTAILPGSSIKGAFRTILLNLYIDEDKDDAFYKNKENLTNRRGKFSDATLIKRHLGKDANSDMLRLMRTGDAHFDQTVCLLTKSVNQKHAGHWEFKQQIQQYIECIPAGASTTFRYSFNELLDRRAKENKIKLQRRKGNRNRRDSNKGLLFERKNTEDMQLAALFKFTNQHTESMLKVELALWEKEENYPLEVEIYLEKLRELSQTLKELIDQQEQKVGILRIGWGTGFKNMTGDWQSDRLSNALYDKLLVEVRDRRYEDFILPKTRRMTAEGLPLGFVKMTKKV